MDDVYFESSVLRAQNSFQINKDDPTIRGWRSVETLLQNEKHEIRENILGLNKQTTMNGIT